MVPKEGSSEEDCNGDGSVCVMTYTLMLRIGDRQSTSFMDLPRLELSQLRRQGPILLLYQFLGYCLGFLFQVWARTYG